MLHKLENGYYVISSHQCALPGCYDSERAARYAFRFSNQALQALQDTVNSQETDHTRRVISFEMLQQYARERKHP